jgi:hypothetical protein
MSRMKLKIAAVATAIIATAGTASVATATMTVDAGKSTTKIGGSWCC